ncbi:hypothetical protein [Ralstonia sp.]|uniref:hypothetical protein n=1 Tax=Ralstonia sp. TaxID=54061 RepID=UPI0039797BAE
MATVTVTIEDRADGSVDMTLESNPPMPEDKGSLTSAQLIAYAAVGKVREYVEENGGDVREPSNDPEG